MSFFLFIILCLVIWFVILPAIKVGMTVNRFRKQARDMFNSFAGGQGTGNQRTKHGAPESQPKRARKIDPSIAETVEFEEIACNVKQTGTGANGDTVTTEYTETESQVVDVEWEDLPS